MSHHPKLRPKCIVEKEIKMSSSKTRNRACPFPFLHYAEDGMPFLAFFLRAHLCLGAREKDSTHLRCSSRRAGSSEPEEEEERGEGKLCPHGTAGVGAHPAQAL